MRVLFYLADQNPWRDRSIGITGYTDGLIRGLQGRGGIEIEALTSLSSYQPPEPAKVHRIPLRTERTAARLLVDQACALVPANAELWHFPKGILPLAVKPRAPTVGTVHDTIVMHYARHYPETRSQLEFAYWRLALQRSLSRLDVVVTVSEHARRQILELCEASKIAAPRIEVTYEGARWESEAGLRTEKSDYVLHLGSAAPHKRTATLLQHWSALQRGGKALPRLRVMGTLDAASSALAASLRDVEVRGHADDLTLRDALRQARALLLPSEIEGFGLPALEAYYLGTPVVYVAGTSVHEMLGPDAPGAFVLKDADSLWAALERVTLLDSDVVARRALELRERFGWQRCVERTVAVYETLLRG